MFMHVRSALELVFKCIIRIYLPIIIVWEVEPGDINETTL